LVAAYPKAEANGLSCQGVTKVEAQVGLAGPAAALARKRRASAQRVARRGEDGSVVGTRNPGGDVLVGCAIVGGQLDDRPIPGLTVARLEREAVGKVDHEGTRRRDLDLWGHEGCI